MSPIMIKLLLLLGTAILTLAATIPGPALNSTLSDSAAPSQGGGFIKHCRTYSSSSFSISLNIPFLLHQHNELTPPPSPVTHNVGERGDLIGRLTGQCGDDESFDDLHVTWIDLNECLGNNNGKLVWQEKYVLHPSIPRDLVLCITAPVC